MSIVYRLQDGAGRGPWKPGFSKHWVISRPDHANLLPWTAQVTREQLNEWFRKYRHLGCACQTVADLRRWFIEREYRILLSLGYDAVSLPIDEVLWSDGTQIVFGRGRPLNYRAVPFVLYGNDFKEIA